MRASVFASRLRHRRRVSVEVLEERQLLATITVNTAGDPATPGTTMSLRQAIEVSDGTLSVSSLSAQEQAQVSGAVGATNTINFNIPTTDPGYDATTKVWTIAVKSALPAISTNAAIIDGYTQLGASPNTLGQGDNAVLKIALSGAGQGTIDGLTIAQEGSHVSGLDIENFGRAGSSENPFDDGYGIVVTAAGNVQVAGCFIGSDPTGTIAAPNANGVEIETSSNLIGGPNVSDRNIISGNSEDGLDVLEQVANPLNIEPTGNRIENNYIGIDAAGTKALGNTDGVGDGGSGDTYGGTAAGLGNVISGNQDIGLYAGGSVTIEGNYVGTNPTGNVALGNGDGISATQAAGGPSPVSVIITNNVASGNGADGIYVSQLSQASPATYTIADNLVGTNAAGTAAMGNGADGIFLQYVTGSSILDNVSSANETGLNAFNCASDVFQGNRIGTDETGQVALGNRFGGIELTESTGNTFGGTGPGQGNVIADNGTVGISVDEGQQNLITHNSIFGNTDAGISLNPGVGQLEAAPVLTFTPTSASTGTLSGTLNASPSLAYTVEVFSNPSAVRAGDEQGKTFVQDVTVDTDSTGKGTFSVTEPLGFYTATATDPSGNTSAFSNAVGVQSLATTQTAVSSSANPLTVGQAVTFTAVVTAPGYQGTPTGMVSFTIDGHAQSPVALAMVGGIDEAQFTTSTLEAGTHTVSASYSGDAKVGASSGSLPTETVTAPGLQTTTTTLASSLDPSTVGQPVSFTALVTAPSYQGTPTGTVTFTIDGQAQKPVSLSVVGGKNEALFVTSTLSAGSHTVSASYSGDNNVSASSGSLLTQTVTAPGLKTTTTTLASSLDPSTAGQPVTFTAVVSPSGAAGTPSGSVTFTIDGVSQSPVPLKVASGRDQATLSIASLGEGRHTISAAYTGDSSFATSAVATPLVQTVKAVTNPAVDGPTVVDVKRFGIHMQPTELVLSFNNGLDPTSAQNLSNYKIVGPAGHAVRIGSAVFDDATNTVTLHPTRRINLHHTYRLTVIGAGPHGVTNTEGVPLDGASTGKPGSNYAGTLTWRNVVWAPGDLDKNGHPKPYRPGGALNHKFLSKLQ